MIFPLNLNQIILILRQFKNIALSGGLLRMNFGLAHLLAGSIVGGLMGLNNSLFGLFAGLT